MQKVKSLENKIDRPINRLKGNPRQACVSAHLPPDLVPMLDRLAEKLAMSRSNCMAAILRFSIQRGFTESEKSMLATFRAGPPGVNISHQKSP